MVHALLAGACFSFACIGWPRQRRQWWQFAAAVSLSQAAFLIRPWDWPGMRELEVFCAWTLVCWPFATVAAFLCGARAYRAAWAVSLAVVLPFILAQGLFAWHVQSLWREMASMSVYAESYKAEHGEYPRGAKTYEFRRPYLRRYIKFWDYDGEWYVVSASLHDFDDTTWELSPDGWTYHDD